MGQEFIAHDGPMDGQPLLHRPEFGYMGVLLVDKPAKLCWVYDWDEERQLFTLAGDDRALDDAKRFQAAMSREFDVIAAPWVGAEGDEWRR